MIFEAQVENKKYKVEIKKTKEAYIISIGDEFTKEVSQDWKNILVLKNHVFHTAAMQLENNSFRTFVNGKTVLLALQTESQKLRQSLEVVETQSSLTTSMPGKITKILVRVGDAVKKGQSLIIMEAMKMENVLKSPCDGKVSKIHVKQDHSVEANTTLIALEPNA